MTKNTILLSFIVSGFVFAGCTTTPITQSEPAMTPESSPSTQEESMMKKDSDMTITMSSFAFSSDTISAKPGQILTIKLVNSEGFHDFVIDELDVKSNVLKMDEEEIITITIPEDAMVGTSYEYYCSVGDHRAQGMVGKLMIE